MPMPRLDRARYQALGDWAAKCCIALDPTVASASLPIGYAAIGGFNANTPTTPGHIFEVTCTANCGSFTWADKTGDLPDIPVDSIIVNPNQPQQVFAGTD